MKYKKLPLYCSGPASCNKQMYSMVGGWTPKKTEKRKERIVKQLWAEHATTTQL